MHTRVLNRYETDDNGRFIIDVAAEGIEELYSHFDRNAPYVRRDLDPELTDYLIDCAHELERNPFVIRFSLKRQLDKESLTRIANSMHQYFTYLSEREQRRITRMVRKSLLLLSLGLLILSLAVWVNQWVGADRGVVANVFAQGLTVAAWVSLWEALATFLIEWFPQRRRVKLFLRLANAPLDVRLQPQ
ncbi:MAG: hypothetical protein RLZZ385_1179 [Pseudomonadota bacterium]|jgi:hypothetical protein